MIMLWWKDQTPSPATALYCPGSKSFALMSNGQVLALILTKTRLSENHEKKLKRAFVGNDANNVLVL